MPQSELTIVTKRLRLVAGTAEITRAAVEDRSAFSNHLGASVPANWPEELLVDAEPWIAETLANDPDSAGWWIWYIVLTGQGDGADDVLIGNVGLKGRPDDAGMVESGWSVLEQFRCHGYATEAMRALMEWAFRDPRVMEVAAETYSHLLPSIRVMENCGMRQVAKASEDGLLRYQASRPK